MRRRTVRSGLRFLVAGVICVILATFFHAEISRFLFLGMADQAKLTFLGFIIGWMCGGWGALVAVAGFVQRSSGGEDRVRLAPSFLLLVALIALFFVLAYNSMTTPSAPPLQPGESINI